jgi:hypothetical protein
MSAGFKTGLPLFYDIFHVCLVYQHWDWSSNCHWPIIRSGSLSHSVSSHSCAWKDCRNQHLQASYFIILQNAARKSELALLPYSGITSSTPTHRSSLESWHFALVGLQCAFGSKLILHVISILTSVLSYVWHDVPFSSPPDAPLYFVNVKSLGETIEKYITKYSAWSAVQVQLIKSTNLSCIMLLQLVRSNEILPWKYCIFNHQHSFTFIYTAGSTSDLLFHSWHDSNSLYRRWVSIIWFSE